MKKITYFLLIIFCCTTSFAQKQTFDVVSYSVPKGWQQKQNDGSVQLLASDKKNNTYIMAIITNASPSNATAIENFNSKWKAAIADQIQLDGEPTMQPSSNGNGWDIETGSAIYTDNGAKGNVALLSATGGGQTVSVVIMYNSNQYEKELAAFLNSLELVKPAQNNTGSSPENTNNTGNSSVAGLWTNYNTESNGSYNGYPTLTGGYMRREYFFKPDGTYTFRSKDWMVYGPKYILFVYETGTYIVNGNQLTLTPKKGRGEWWGKTNRTSEWGTFVKASTDYKLEKATYTFEMKYYSGMKKANLIFKTAKSTVRDETGSGKTGMQDYIYNKRTSGESLIDNPPGFKADTENKSVTIATSSSTSTTSSANTGNSSITGLWTDYILETTGYYINGQPQYTAGYLRKEYAFYPDGTYLFRNKQWLTKAKDILFIYENGNYTVNGNQLTLTPKQGKGEFWSKTSSSKEWGKLLKSSEYNLEKVTYSFEIIKDPNYGNSIVLKPGKPTQRDGGKFNAPNAPYEFRYKDRSELGSLIDNPPGLKTGFENKSFTAAVASPSKNTTTVNAVTSPLTGKIWEGTTTEKFSGGTMNGYNTGGFSTSQYKFNADGTYRFVSVIASHYTDTKSLGYETGTYTISGEQLTINPANGQNEEWSKVGKTSNGNSDVTNRAINETWNKKIKTVSRKLKKYTYTFSIGKNGDKAALILQRNGSTEREGDGKISYLNETAPEKSVKLPEDK